LIQGDRIKNPMLLKLFQNNLNRHSRAGGNDDRKLYFNALDIAFAFI